MPTGQDGKFHLNTQRAHAADRMAAKPKTMATGAAMPKPDGEGGESPVHEHLKALHEQMGGKHMHVHSDGLTHTTHHVGEDGEVQGPHDHDNIEALKEHMGKFLDEEAGEKGDEQEGSEMPMMHHASSELY